ncbi:toll/interleukin-1 receptor domain-containing protein [Chryseobacterium cucumeris]|uniref:toll/interleukin-1 receptor domain-containing protein n=1 Tax=Chryseobacterium cucumeris TaxID=1813611 RepID=UPI003D971C3B
MYKYQIIFLGTITQLAQEIQTLIYQKIDELKMKGDLYKVLYAQNISEYKGNQPTFIIYFGNKKGMHEDVDLINKLLQEGNIVLPIYFTAGDQFNYEIPAALHGQNGLLFSHSKMHKIADLVLESFGKLRNTRKIFISYRRKESSSVAIQLYEALEANNFDVFLDTHSITQGEPFQDELWHRMTDCDVILVLNTEEFLKSGWCEKEIAEASVKQIGVIQLVWPKNKLERMAEVCFPKQLTEDDFIDGNYTDPDKSKLTEAVVEDIIAQVESVRARNLAARQDNLITEFLNAARKNGKEMNIQPERFITEKIDDEKRRIFIPSVGIPQSIDCNQSSELKKEIREFNVSEVYLIYDDVRIREHWIKHLQYLNEHLDVKTIKKQEFDLWLQKN